MRKFMTAAALAMIAVPALAHDFWIQPDRFVYDVPAIVPISMFVGHGQARDRWGVSVDHIVLFNTFGPDGFVDRRPELRMNSKTYDARVTLAKSGGYVFGLQSNYAESSLPAVRFNDYVKSEGVTPILAYRTRNRQERADGREMYSRRAKAIVQVGPVDANSITRVTTPMGFLLEIVPERHPQSLGSGNTLPVKVLFKGKPLAGALVKLTNLANDAKPVATRRTDRHGRTSFKISQPGNWQMNVVWAETLGDKAKADFKTTFSSLSFATE